MGWTTTGCTVRTSKQTASTILFCRPGAKSVFQVETEEIHEIRGLTEDAARAKVPDAAGVVDNTVETVYYAFIDSLVFSLTARTGAKSEWAAARADESGQWVAQCRTRSFAVKGLDTAVWGTTPLNENGEAIVLSADGRSRVASVDSSFSVACQAKGGTALVTKIETSLSEIRYVSTEQAAYALVQANDGTSMNYLTYVYRVSTGLNESEDRETCTVPQGVEKSATMRFVSPKEGWSVFVTAKYYNVFPGTGWVVAQ